jgi:hypothetical protein
MTMAANAYKTQTGTPDKVIVELLIAGFSAQLKGWWDYHLTETDHLNILNSFHNMRTKHPSLTHPETLSKTLCQPLFLQFPYILLETLPI